jgi:hypothetical protein
MALSSAVQEAIWLEGILKSLDMYSQEAIKVFCENQGSIKLAKNPINHSRTKHIDMRHHFVREAVEDKRIQLRYVDTKENVADMLTKPLNNISLRGYVRNILSCLELF